MSKQASRSSERSDLFERAYTASIVEEDRGPAPLAFRDRAIARLAPSEPFALRGCVITPDRVLDDGYVVLGVDGTIASVQERAPEGVRVHATNGVVLPGLIDLHGHPEFNVFAAWEPPKQYDNRFQWRDSPGYKQVIRGPWNRLQDKPTLKWTAARYAEIRALIAGTTAIQGATPQYPTEEALVRNVDKRIFGQHHARSMIDLPTESSRDFDDLKRIVQQIGAGNVTAFYVHIAEGKSTDERSHREFARLVEFGALTPATILIHGTALSRDELGQVKDAGAKLVWSPQSNLRLYGETTRASDALALGIPVGLGADWLPSGSQSLLAELKIARRILARQGATIAARQLVCMVTRDAARIAGLEDHLGLLDVGRPADILVLERRTADPWENVVEAEPSWVELVMIGGDLTYGRSDWLQVLTAPEVYSQVEQVIAWGKPMALDTSYSVSATATRPRLADLRAALIERYPQVGPIFA